MTPTEQDPPIPPAMTKAPAEVEPALSLAQWRTLHARTSAEYDGTVLSAAVANVRGLTDDELPQVIAAANAALLDSDPRKITREWVVALRETVEHDAASNEWGYSLLPDHVALFLAMADVLESYLPPEGS